MTQALYAHMNNNKIRKKINKGHGIFSNIFLRVLRIIISCGFVLESIFHARVVFFFFHNWQGWAKVLASPGC
jgi:hypothetical protein